MQSCQLTIDFNAVAYCKYFYRNKVGDTRRILPRYPTVNGSAIPNESMFGSNETMLQVATRRKLLDTWIPICVLQFRNNHSMKFTGDKAKQMKRNYDKHIYEKT